VEFIVIFFLIIAIGILLFFLFKEKKQKNTLSNEVNNINFLLESSINSFRDVNIYMLDKEFRYLKFNNAHKKSMKQTFDAEIKVGSNKLQFLPEKIRDQYKKLYEGGFAGNVTTHKQVFGEFHLKFDFLPVANNSKEIYALTTIATDISENEQAKEKLFKFTNQLDDLVDKKSHEIVLERDFILGVIDEIHNYIFVRNRKGAYSLVNKGFALNLGFENKKDLIGKTVFETHINKAEAELFHREDLEVLDNAKQISREVQFKTGDGKTTWFYLTKKKINFQGEEQVLGVQTDITSLKETQYKLERTNSDLKDALHEVKNFQLKLIESEKLATVGQLTAGLIHEINNPINYVSGNVDPLIRNLDDFEEWLTKSELYQSEDHLVKETVDESKLLLNGVKEGAERVKELMISLKSLSQPDKSDSVLFNLNNGIKSTVNLLRPTVKDRIDFQLDLGDLVEIQCNRGQIQQVFLNILDNAIDAIEESGVIEIQSYKKESKNIILITDNGKGISNDNLNRIFEPFYTTKEFGHGSGLGLSISKRIMSEHNGDITVESNPGKTTTVTIIFNV